MLNRLKTWSVVTVTALMGVSVSACQLSPASLVPHLGADPNTTDPSLIASAPTVTTDVSGTSTSNKPNLLGTQNVAAHLGSIDDQIQLTGRVAGADETEITFTDGAGGKVAVINVKPGDAVDQGQVLLQTDAQQIQRDLTAAQARVETASLRVQQAQGQNVAAAEQAQAETAKRAADDQARRQQAMQDAQNALRKAQENYDKIAAGPSSTAVRSAQVTLSTAQAQLIKATDARDKLLAGPNPDDVRAAQRSVASAQTDLDKAQSQLDALTRGPDPDSVRAGERDVERAQTALKLAQATKADGTNTTQAQKDALVSNAQLALQDATDRLNKLKQPADPTQVAIAQRNLQVAKAAADAAQQQLQLVLKGPDQSQIDAANQVVDTAQAAVNNAQDQLDELTSHPTPTELRDAQEGVNQARAALTRASARAEIAAPFSNPSAAFDMQILQQSLAQEQANVQSLQKQLDATKLLAPFAGTVTNVLVRQGDTVDPAHGVLTLAKPGAEVIRVDMTEADAARLRVGQDATAVLDGSADQLPATILTLKPNPNAQGRIAQIQVDWPAAHPKIGRTAQVTVTIAHKDNVLLIPRKAVRMAGTRAYVQYQSGSSRKIANIEVGIMSPTDAEVISGLSAGQVVVVGP